MFWNNIFPQLLPHEMPVVCFNIWINGLKQIHWFKTLVLLKKRENGVSAELTSLIMWDMLTQLGTCDKYH